MTFVLNLTQIVCYSSKYLMQSSKNKLWNNKCYLFDENFLNLFCFVDLTLDQQLLQNYRFNQMWYCCWMFVFTFRLVSNALLMSCSQISLQIICLGQIYSRILPTSHVTNCTTVSSEFICFVLSRQHHSWSTLTRRQTWKVTNRLTITEF